MKIVIELVDDSGKPFTTEKGLAALRTMLRDSTGDDGCLAPGHLELADLDGRCLLARVEGVVEEKFEALVPYVAPPLGEEVT